MFDVAIIGAGVVGGLIARELSLYGLRICVLEKENDAATGASAANSGIVHAGFDAKPGTLKAKFNVIGAEMMEAVCRELGVKYKRDGSLVVGFGPEDRKNIELLLEKGRRNGVKRLDILGKEQLHTLEPGLSEAADCALWAPTAGIVCPYELTFAAVGCAMDNGAKLFTNFRVCRIGRRTDGNPGYEIEAADGRLIRAELVVNCAGVYSDRIAQMVGDNSFTITPRRGDYMLLDKTSGRLCTHTVFRTPTKMGKGILVSPTVDGNTLLGPTSEDIGDKDDTSVTEAGLERILSQVKQEFPGVNSGSVITSFCGLRAHGSTGDFVIGSPAPDFINAAAIESPGLTSSPAIAVHVRELAGGILEAHGKKLVRDPDAVSGRKALHWFRELSENEKNAVIAKEPEFGRIICRCEQITEGELRYAMRTDPRPADLDGVKRRTRAQMGRCQGGFCSPNIVRMLAEELGIPFEAVTKSGAGSYINVGRTK